MEAQAQWFLFDDIWNWLYCKYRKCDEDKSNHPTAESQKDAQYRHTGGMVNSDQTGTNGKLGQEFSNDASTSKHQAHEHDSNSHLDDNKGGDDRKPLEPVSDGRSSFFRISGAQTTSNQTESAKTLEVANNLL